MDLGYDVEDYSVGFVDDLDLRRRCESDIRSWQ
jgi:hypothetical protein